MKRCGFWMVLIAISSLAAGCSKNDVSKGNFGEVIEAAEKVKTYQYKETESLKNLPPVTTTIFVKSPGLTRTEYSDGRIRIDDSIQKIVLMIDPKAEKVIVRKEKGNVGSESPASFADMLQTMVKKSNRELLGKKVVGGKNTVGYRFTHEGVKETFWIDLETKLPIEHEITQIISDPFMPSSGMVRRVDSDYVYNPVLKDSLFSLTPPEGYAIEEQKPEVAVVPDEKAFLAGLKLWAEQNGNQFPDELNLLKLIALNFRSDVKVSSGTLKKISEQVLAFAREQHKQKNVWRYWGKGVKLGEKEKLVYWYQPMKDKPYRVVYGDLSVREVEKDNLPTTQPSSQPAEK
jgi:outer membrane lipoprotein-sorting protein